MPIAAISTALPFKENSFDRIYAYFSIPYYLKSPQEIKISLQEMIRTIKGDGVIKVYPVDEDNLTIVKQVLNHTPNIEFDLDEKVKDTEWLLTIKKFKNNINS